MNRRRFGALGVVLCVVSMVVPARAVDDATLFRVFLRDGTSLVSYGEVARVGDRVVFSMPTSASTTTPALQLVNIPADRVDWVRTSHYADSARATQYLATQAARDYAVLSNSIAQALNEIGQTDDSAKRLVIVERARKTLASWPLEHFNYKQDEVQQMLAILDEAIADLRARTGATRFNLSFVAAAAPPPVMEPLLPPPTPKEAIEQTLRAARLTEIPAERIALLTMVVTGLDRDAKLLPPEWRATTSAATRASIAGEVATDQQYDSLTKRMLAVARVRARAADVRGIQRLVADIRTQDAALGGKRRDTVTALIDSVEAQLDAARRFQLERDRWQLRIADYKVYSTKINAPLARLDGLRPSLENIKTLAGSGPAALGQILREAGIALKAFGAVTPPDEFRAAHALLMSASQLADSAARTRREAALTGDMGRAWDASSAAAGALMLTERARADIQALIRVPQLSP